MISLSDIYDKDVNFLFGSGASFGLLPTLKLEIKREVGGEGWTLEDLATHLEGTEDKRLIPLFMHYYLACIYPAEALNIESANKTINGRAVIDNYRRFLETVLVMLQRRKALERRCNIFTTNYDGCFPLVADEIIQRGQIDFVLNDGARGFTKRVLQAKNFSSFLCQTGVFGRHQSSIPQINLIHLHGSVYWSKSGNSIQVAYDLSESPLLLSEPLRNRMQQFSSALTNSGAVLDDLPDPGFTRKQLDSFWGMYKQKPIVSPTKRKFYETVYEEHYYQMLRLLSYELEKPNAVLITFGFSFADEHILNLVMRSLSNPGLQVFVCCFDSETHLTLSEVFGGCRNVQCLVLDDGVMDFTAFNERVIVWPSVKQPAGATASAPPANVGAETLVEEQQADSVEDLL